MSDVVIQNVVRQLVIPQDDGPDVQINQPSTRILALQAVGLQGPPGNAGPGATPSFTFTQSIPAMVWTIDHSLGYRPIIAITDDTGEEIEATVNHPTTARTTVVFSRAVSGLARLF